MASAFTQTGYRCVEADCGAAAIDAIRTCAPSIVVLEVSLPDISGYEVCHLIRRELGNRVAVILVSGSRTDPADRVAGLLIGADEYLKKPVSMDELLVRSRALVERLRPVDARHGVTLTPRENDVFRLLAEGLEQNRIATILAISPRTVATHIERILRKVGAKSRAHAVAIAYQRGFMSASARWDDGSLYRREVAAGD